MALNVGLLHLEAFLSLHLGNKLHLLNIPIHLISGDEDSKYFKIAYKSMQINKNVKHYKVKNAGHNTHLENPDLFINIINSLEL